MWPFKPKPLGNGFIHSREQHEDPRNITYERITFGGAEIPKEGDVFDRRPYIMNQWRSNSCTAHASAQVFHLLAGKRLSPRHAYWKIKTDKSYQSSNVSYGAYLKDPFVAMIQGVADYDVVPNPEFSMNDDEYLNFEETPESVNSAMKNGLGGVYIYPTTAGGSAKIFDETVRYMHELKRPVVLGVDWYPEYNNARKGGIIPTTYAKSSPTGHAICAVAWKEIDGEPYVGCVNSWGANWGDNGLVWLPRNYSRIYTAIGWLPPEVQKDLKIVKPEPLSPEIKRDLAKERANAQELRAFIETKFPDAGDAQTKAMNNLARSIGGKEWHVFIRAVVYLGWTFEDVVNYLYARSRGKTRTKAYKLDFTIKRYH